MHATSLFKHLTMDMASAYIALTDLTSVGESRRAGIKLATTLGMDEVQSGELGIVITEAARNAVVHGGGGHVIITPVPAGAAGPKVDVLVLDNGRGIKDMALASQDGYSTAGTPGTGLGAIRRMAGTFDLFSSPRGTAVLAQINGAAPPSSISSTLEIAGFAVPIAGESVCGDRIAWKQSTDRTLVLAVDGLGHGMGAADAADEAVRIFDARADESPSAILSRMHDALKKTRGAAASIAEVRPLSGVLTYAGIGNISAVVISHQGSRSLISHNGTLGHIVARVQEFKIDWPRDGILVMHSDGLQTRWDLSQYPGLLARKPALIAGVLFRDYRRQRDDSSVVVVKGRP